MENNLFEKFKEKAAKAELNFEKNSQEGSPQGQSTINKNWLKQLSQKLKEKKVTLKTEQGEIKKINITELFEKAKKQMEEKVKEQMEEKSKGAKR